MDTLSQIIKFNRIANNFTYGLAISGKVQRRNITADDWDMIYRLASPSQFVKQGGGVCWDWTTYEADYFRLNFPNVRFDTFYIVFDNKKDCPTHTFLTFTLDGELYYFESSFYKFRGVYKAKSFGDIFNFVMSNMNTYSDTKDLLDYKSYVTKYDALNPMIYGMNCAEFMDYCIHSRRVNHHYNPNFTEPIKIK